MIRGFCARSAVVVAVLASLAWGSAVSAEQPGGQLRQLRPDSVEYAEGVDFDVMVFSGAGNAATDVAVVPNLGCDASDFGDLPPGAIALIQRGECLFSTKVDNATLAGASGVLVYNNRPGLVSGTLQSQKEIPVMGITDTLGAELRSAPGLRMRMFVPRQKPDQAGRKPA